MSEIDTATTKPTTETGLSDDALEAAVQATNAARFEDTFRPPTQPAADTDTNTTQSEDQEPAGDDTGGAADADTLSWLLAEAQHRLDNPDPNSEAARHRIARREAEAQTQAVSAKLEAMQRSAIDAQVTALHMKPAALWAAGTKLADLLGDDGVPDPAKVEAAAEAAKEQLGIPAPKMPPRGLSSGASSYQPPRNDWVGAFGPAPG